MNGPFNSTQNAEDFTFQEDRLVYMTLVNGATIHRCMTIARSLMEAEKRAREHYGKFFVLNGWGTRRLPIESMLMGGGHFIRSSRDAQHKHSLVMINSLR